MKLTFWHVVGAWVAFGAAYEAYLWYKAGSPGTPSSIATTLLLGPANLVVY